MVTKNKSPERDDAQLFFSMLNRSDKSGTLIDRVNNRCCFYTVFFTGKLSKYTVSVCVCVCVCVCALRIPTTVHISQWRVSENHRYDFTDKLFRY